MDLLSAVLAGKNGPPTDHANPGESRKPSAPRSTNHRKVADSGVDDDELPPDIAAAIAGMDRLDERAMPLYRA